MKINRLGPKPPVRSEHSPNKHPLLKHPKRQDKAQSQVYSNYSYTPGHNTHFTVLFNVSIRIPTIFIYMHIIKIGIDLSNTFTHFVNIHIHLTFTYVHLANIYSQISMKIWMIAWEI